MKSKLSKSRPGTSMGSKAARALRVLTLAAFGVGGLTLALADDPPMLPEHFSGLLNDYTPSSVNGTPIKGGPYEIHGSWTLDLDETRTMARFSAEMTMATADFLNADSSFDPATLGAHTHHIAVTGGTVHDGSTDWKSMCPKLSPAVTGGFVVTGSAYVSVNGGNPPFGNPSPVTICILGGTNPNVPGAAYVEFSNFTLSLGSPASAHFGPQPMHGVVVRCGWPRWDSRPCQVTVDK